MTPRRRIGDGRVARAHFGRILVQEAASLALSYFERYDALEITSKGQQDMVSEADHAIERLIRERLGERFPDDAFLGEEIGMAGRGDAKGLWVVDPLDGTQPFICGMTSWCVSIAYIEDGSPHSASSWRRLAPSCSSASAMRGPCSMGVRSGWGGRAGSMRA